MAISVICTNPSCAVRFPRPDSEVGRTVQCPACGKAQVVPRPGEVAPGPPELGHYRLLRPLARGGMGEIFEAVHLQFNRRVALKVIAPHLARDPEALLRFEREARLATALRHPNAVTVYEFGQAEGRYFLAMEFIEGEDLASRVAQKGRLPIPEALALVEQVAAALQVAHAKGIVHRDVKPANILVTREGVAKLTDLGLARRLGEGSSLTLTQVSLGTPDFISPEQALSARRVDHRADIYSLGTTLYFLVTGRRPFGGETEQAILQAHLKQPLPEVAEPGLEGSREVDLLLRGMTAKLPDDRYPDCQRLIGDFRRVRAGLEPLGPRGGPTGGGQPAPLSGLKFLLVIGVAALLLGLLAGWLVTR
jgi:eukaryotic-like serine/threonine-protein kinase